MVISIQRSEVFFCPHHAYVVHRDSIATYKYRHFVVFFLVITGTLNISNILPRAKKCSVGGRCHGCHRSAYSSIRELLSCRSGTSLGDVTDRAGR